MPKFNPTKLLVTFLLVACLLLAGNAMAQSQASTGQITGTVKDAAGALITGAAIKVTNVNTGYEQTATSTDAGLYTAQLLPPGHYKVVASHAGFADQTSELDVGVGRTLVINFSLPVGARKESITVTAEAIEVTRHDASSFINSTVVSSLPLNGGRFHDLAQLTPTVQFDPSRGGLDISGQRGINASVTVDGASYDNPFFGGMRGGERAGQTPTMPIDAVQEFQVVRAGYSAEFGRSTGGIMTAVTKSGSNAFHGDGFLYWRPQDLSGNTPFYDAVRSSLITPFGVVAAPNQLQWGGGVGGPIKKDKLFFYGAYTQQRVRQSRAILFTDIPTYTPNAALLENVPYNYYIGQQGPYSQTNDAKVFLGKGDWVISNNHRLSFKYNRSTNEAQNAATNGTAPNPVTANALSNNGTELDDTHTITGSLASFFHGLTNELRGEYSLEHRPRNGNQPFQPVVSSRAGTYGTISFFGQNLEKDWRLQFADAVTWQHGKHTVKFGGEYNHLNASQIFGFDQFGDFSVSTPSGTLASQLELMGANGTLPLSAYPNCPGANCPFSAAAGATLANRYDNTRTSYSHNIGNYLATMTGEMPALFFQDSWRVFPTFTLNFGLRWEGQKNPQPDASNAALTNLVKNQVWPLSAAGIVPAKEDPSYIPNAMNQFAPRFGFAWDVMGNGKTVVRGFSGIYYAASPLLLFAGPTNNFRAVPGDQRLFFPLTPKAGSLCATSITTYQQILCGTGGRINLNNFAPGSEPALTTADFQQIGASIGYPDLTLLTSPLMMDNNFKNPRSTQVGFGFEREVMRGWVVTADVDWIKTVHLERNTELNLPMPTGICPATQLTACLNATTGRPQYGLTLTNHTDPVSGLTVPGGVPRPIASLGSVQARTSNGKSLYRALTIGTRYNASKRVQLQMYYTRSEGLSDDDNERNAGGISYSDASTPLYYSREYYFSTQDRRQQFVASPVVTLPFGFEVATSLRFLSGVPLFSTSSSALLDVSTGSDLNQDKVSGNDRPFFAPGVMMHRNQFRQPGFKTIDLRIQKTQKVAEGKDIVASVDLFNLFNWMNLQYASNTELNYCGTFTSFGVTTGSSASATCGFAAPTNPAFMKFQDMTLQGILHGSPYLTNSAPGPVRQVQFAFKFVF